MQCVAKSRRSTWLTGEQLEELLGALDAYPDQSAADAIRLLILTGAREGEVLSANWDQFDLRRGIWTKPRHQHQAEKGRAHAVERRGTATVASRAYDPYFPSPLPRGKRSASDEVIALPCFVSFNVTQ